MLESARLTTSQLRGDLDVAAKPVDFDHSTLVRLADHAIKLLREFIALNPADRHKMTELLAELEEVIVEFRRKRPPLTFRRETPTLHLVRACAICGVEIGRLADRGSIFPNSFYLSLK